METKPEVLALVEGWLREQCPETPDMKAVHIFARICELSLVTFKDSGTIKCHPGRQYLAHLVNWSVTKVSRTLSKLKTYGALKSFQPRSFDPKKQAWVPSTNVYTVPLLTPLRVKQLAVAMRLKLGARMFLFSSSERKKENKTCVQPILRKPSIVGHVARQVYARVMNMAKGAEEPKVKINTGNAALNGLLNRFATLGRPTL